MCGFIGFTGYLENRREILQKMADRIMHRGPDMGDYYLDDGIALGFRRLSIIDLSEAACQPMQNEDGSVVLVFNGEIYNFMGLREKLIAAGHVFRTHGDSEVLVHGYEEYGEKLPEMLRGMFAFVVWDKNKQSLFGARDPFGIKPLYYSVLDDGSLLFGSEIKSFLEHPDFRLEVNPEALRPYLTFQYSALPETFFKGTFKLPQAHQFTFKDGKIEITRYWDVDFSKKNGLTFDETAKMIDDRVHESVTAHRISDVPVGSFLSGGVDSSYITSTLQPDDTFTVGFADSKKFDETVEANQFSHLLNVQNYCEMLTAEQCFEAFPTIQYHMDEPQSNPSSVPLYFLARLAKQHVTVILSGEGADEIYAGYEWYCDDALTRKYKKLPGFLRRGVAAVVEHLPYFKGHDFLIKASGKPENYFIGQALVFPEKEAADILKPEFRCGPSAREVTRPIYERTKGLSELEKKQYLDMNLWLPGDILLKADKMSMAHSIEARVPYLDRRVMEEAETIPSEYKIRGDETKSCMRAAAGMTVPAEWAKRIKKGFPVPIRNWLREEPFYSDVKRRFSSDVAATYFYTDKLLKLLEDHKEGRAQNGRKIWTVYTFLVWYDEFFSAKR